MSRRILVCGGRDYTDGVRVWAELDKLHKADPIDEIVEGGASGADSFAGSWARARGVISSTIRADWDKYGRAAGSVRNRQMLELHRPDLVLAFPGGIGTAHMVRIARDAGVPVAEIPRN